MAYEVQHAEDIECFLQARAQEIVNGGLKVLIIPGRPNDTPHTLSSLNQAHQLLRFCPMDLARKGVVREEKVDPLLLIYLCITCLLKNSKLLWREMVVLAQTWIPRVPALDNVTKSSQLLASHVRAATEGLMKQQFGDKILDELFDLYRKKLEEQPSIFESGKAINLPVVLKHTKN